jgi:TPR repeat protein
MTTRLSFVLLLVLSLFLMAAIAMGEEGRPIPTIYGLLIDDKDIPIFEEKALDGDPEAARRLSTFHGIRGERVQSIYWATIAAENGSVVGQYNLGFLLRDDPDPKNRRRAIYWLKRVSASDDRYTAALAMQLLEEITKK